MNASLKKIHLVLNALDDDCMKSLGEYIQANTFIEQVSIGYNRITGVGIEILIPFLYGNTTFRCLSLEVCFGIGVDAASSFCKLIESSRIDNLDFNMMVPMQNNLIAIPLANNVLKNGSAKMNLRTM